MKNKTVDEQRPDTQGNGGAMPIDYKKYPHNWKDIRKCVLHRANHKCELCDAKNYNPHWKTGSKVVLTIHHIDFDVKNNKPYNLIALCQRCHNKLDMPYRIKNRRSRKK
jgi:5-methylcytosine-specific restriction endonuclease McrA